jgi:hypothetical protein
MPLAQCIAYVSPEGRLSASDPFLLPTLTSSLYPRGIGGHSSPYSSNGSRSLTVAETAVYGSSGGNFSDPPRSPPGSGPSRLGSGISSPRRRTGQTLSARTAEGGQSFDPFRPLVRVSIPLFKPSEQESKILFFGVEDRGSCIPVRASLSIRSERSGPQTGWEARVGAPGGCR